MCLWASSHGVAPNAPQNERLRALLRVSGDEEGIMYLIQARRTKKGELSMDLTGRPQILSYPWFNDPVQTQGTRGIQCTFNEQSPQTGQAILIAVARCLIVSVCLGSNPLCCIASSTARDDSSRRRSYFIHQPQATSRSKEKRKGSFCALLQAGNTRVGGPRGTHKREHIGWDSEANPCC